MAAMQKAEGLDENKKWWVARAFLYIGRLTSDKGVREIVLAWHQLALQYDSRCPPLWIAGGRPQEIEQIRRQLNSDIDLTHYESEGRLHWWGCLGPSGLSTLLLRALVLLSHSRYEPGGRVVLEAMSEGVPVIATPHGFADELISDWDDGFLVEFGDIDSLKLRMEHFLRQPLLRAYLGENAKMRARQALNHWQFLETHLAVYDAAADRQPDRIVEHAERADAIFRFAAKVGRSLLDYGYASHPPSKGLVSSFVEAATGDSVIEVFEDIGQQSEFSRWQVRTESSEWVVKKPNARISFRPVWQWDQRLPLAMTDREHFATEAYSASLPGFLQHFATDPGSMLLLTPRLPSVSSRIEGLKIVAEAARRLHGINAALDARLLQILDHDWECATPENANSALFDYLSFLKDSDLPLCRFRCPSLGLALAKLGQPLFDDGPPGSTGCKRWELPPAFEKFLSDAVDLEKSRRASLCHGNLASTTCVNPGDGSPLLIDGGYLHPGSPEQDFARLLLSSAKKVSVKTNQCPYGVCHSLLDAICKPDERRLTVAWAALLTFEALCRNLVMELRDDHLTDSLAALRRIISEMNRTSQ